MKVGPDIILLIPVFLLDITYINTNFCDICCITHLVKISYQHLNKFDIRLAVVNTLPIKCLFMIWYVCIQVSTFLWHDTICYLSYYDVHEEFRIMLCQSTWMNKNSFPTMIPWPGLYLWLYKYSVRKKHSFGRIIVTTHV